MFSLPYPCDADQAIAAIREWAALEEHRLWTSYGPDRGDPDDTGEFPIVTPDPDAGPLSDDEWAAVVLPELEEPAAEPEPFEPSESDREWLAPRSIAEDLQAWEDHREWCEYTDAINAAGRYGDADLAAAGLAVG